MRPGWFVALIALSVGCTRDLELEADDGGPPQLVLVSCNGAPCTDGARVAGTVELLFEKVRGGALTGAELKILGLPPERRPADDLRVTVDTRQLFPQSAGLMLVTVTPLWRSDERAAGQTYALRVDNVPSQVTVLTPARGAVVYSARGPVPVEICLRARASAEPAAILATAQWLSADQPVSSVFGLSPGAPCAEGSTYGGALSLENLPGKAYDDLALTISVTETPGFPATRVDVPLKLSREVSAFPAFLLGSAPFFGPMPYSRNDMAGTAFASAREIVGISSSGGYTARWLFQTELHSVAVSEEGVAVFSCSFCTAGDDFAVGGGTLQGEKPTFINSFSRRLELSGAARRLACVGQAAPPVPDQKDVICHEQNQIHASFQLQDPGTGLGWLGVIGDVPGDESAVLLRWNQMGGSSLLVRHLTNAPLSDPPAHPIGRSTNDRSPGFAHADRFGAVVQLDDDSAWVARGNGSVTSVAPPLPGAVALAVGPGAKLLWRSSRPESTVFAVTDLTGVIVWSVEEPFLSDPTDTPDHDGNGFLATHVGGFDVDGNVYASGSVHRLLDDEGHVFVYDSAGKRRWAWHGRAVRSLRVPPSGTAAVELLDEGYVVRSLNR